MCVNAQKIGATNDIFLQKALLINLYVVRRFVRNEKYGFRYAYIHQ